MGAPLKDGRTDDITKLIGDFCISAKTFKCIKHTVKSKQLLVSATNFNVHHINKIMTHRIYFRKT